MALRLKLDIAGSSQLDRTLAAYSQGLADLSPAFNEIAELVRRSEHALFSSEGGSRGQRWASLSPSYEQWKERVRPGQPILVFSGRLRTELTTRPFGVEHITSDTMRIGTDLPYARYHQTGTTRMPARPVVALSEAERQEAVKIVMRHLQSLKPKAGRRSSGRG